MKHLRLGVSGYSGAGTNPSPNSNVNLLGGNLISHSLTKHIHRRELSLHLDGGPPFKPHDELCGYLRDRRAYEKGKMVRLIENVPLVKGKHQTRVGFGVHSNDKLMATC